MTFIDTHCHIDMLPNPERYLIENEQKGNITIGMTNLPSHFALGKAHFRHLKYSRLALGIHPLLVSEHTEEIDDFIAMIDETSYIGEIGLDFSYEGMKTKHQQLASLDKILTALERKKKIISVHSRRAETELFELLISHDIRNVIFHWYSGKIALIPEIISREYYFSVNEAMCSSDNGRRIISCIPTNRILIETDAPFNQKCDVDNTYSYMHSCGCNADLISSNFKRLLSNIK